MPRQRGFTLVELMVTLVVAAVLITIAVPSFRNMILSNQLTTSANGIVAALNLAKMDAVQRNASVQFCSNLADNNGTDALGTDCTGMGAVYTEVNGSPLLVRASISTLTGSVQLNGDIQAVRFNSQGLGYNPTTSLLTNGTVADICTPSLSSDNHRLIQITTGSIITVTTPATSASCE
jgi:type IV fimbrial biogenesis protein FimT